MKNIFKTFSENNLTEIVFKNRNKSYGAYELRRHYDERLGKAFLFIIGFFVIPVLLFGLVMKNKETISRIVETFNDPDTLHNYVLPHIVPPHPPAAVVSQNSAEINPAIVSDSVHNQHEKPVDTISFNHGSANGSPTGTSNDTSKGTSTVATQPLVLTPDTTTVLPQADVMPQFPGGNDALMTYLAENMSNAYTPIAIELHAEGKVFISFVVDIHGKIKSVKIISDKVGYGCAENAAIIVGEMPDWIPGSNEGVPANIRIVLPVNFKMQYN